MTKPEIEQSVKDCIEQIVSVPTHEIELSDSLRHDLYFDSLDMVELIMDIESHFDIIISDDKAMEWKTVQDIIELIEETL